MKTWFVNDEYGCIKWHMKMFVRHLGDFIGTLICVYVYIYIYIYIYIHNNNNNNNNNKKNNNKNKNNNIYNIMVM